MKHQGILFVWRRVDVTGEEGEVHSVLAMVPVGRYAGIAARQFGAEGSEHVLQPFEPRNMNMHKACFAELNELYNNLPESVWYLTDSDGKFEKDDLGNQVRRFSDVEHFRHWLLIEEGFGDVIECETLQQAKQIAKKLNDPYVSLKRDRSTGKYVIKWANSQALDAMTSQRFRESMDAILARARSFVGVTASTSRRHAGRAA